MHRFEALSKMVDRTLMTIWDPALSLSATLQLPLKIVLSDPTSVDARPWNLKYAAAAMLEIRVKRAATAQRIKTFCLFENHLLRKDFVRLGESLLFEIRRFMFQSVLTFS